jgi:hypothetical protein
LVSSKLNISDINNLQDTLNNVSANNLNVITTPYTGEIEASSFKKTGGSAIEYLMANGSRLTQSANSGNSNYYLYNSSTGDQPIVDGDVKYNDTFQGAASIIWISHKTRDNIDIKVFFNQITTISQIYIQDQANSANFIKYDVTTTPIITGSYIEVPVALTAYGGTGITSFSPDPNINHNIMVSFFTNTLEIDTRISTLENKTQNEISTSGQTNISGLLGVYGIASQAVLGSQTFEYSEGGIMNNSVVGYEFIPTNDIVVSVFLVSNQHWLSPQTTKQMGIYRASDSVLMGSDTLTKMIIQSGYYGKTLSQPIKLYSGIKYVLSTWFVGFYDRYCTSVSVNASFGSSISSIKGRVNTAASFSMPTTVGSTNDADFGNFIYTAASSVSSSKFIVPYGLSTEFLKANGTVDTSTYITTDTAGTTYLAKSGGTMSGTLIAPTIIKSGGLSTEFLKGDGTIDSNTYLTNTSLASYMVSTLYFTTLAVLTASNAYFPAGSLTTIGSVSTLVAQTATNSFTKIYRVNNPPSAPADGTKSGYLGTSIFPKNIYRHWVYLQCKFWYRRY